MRLLFLPINHIYLLNVQMYSFYHNRRQFDIVGSCAFYNVTRIRTRHIDFSLLGLFYFHMYLVCLHSVL